MPKFKWDHSLSVNNAELDEQHKEWIRIYNTLHDSLISGDSEKINTARIEALQTMLEYSRKHFDLEEEYMRSIGYPGLQEHRRLHKNFDNKIYTYYRRYIDGDFILHSEILQLLKEWVIDHISVEDKKYADFFENKNKS